MSEITGVQPVLRLDRITKRFGALTANDAISFDLNAGEVLALLGENGAGKTTLMNILFGQYTADEGSVTLFAQPQPPGNPRAALAARLGMVHQHFTLADNLTVLENIVLGTRPLWALARSRRGRGSKHCRAISGWRCIPMPAWRPCRRESAGGSRSSRRCIATRVCSFWMNPPPC